MSERPGPSSIIIDHLGHQDNLLATIDHDNRELPLLSTGMTNHLDGHLLGLHNRTDINVDQVVETSGQTTPHTTVIRDRPVFSCVNISLSSSSFIHSFRAIFQWINRGTCMYYLIRFSPSHLRIRLVSFVWTGVFDFACNLKLP